MSNVRHVQVKLDEELAQWFDENCPAFSKQDFVEQCFKMLQIAVVLGDLPHPAVYPAKAAVMALATLTETEATDGPILLRPDTQET